VSNRTRSKADYTDQHIGSRTQSKMQNINNLSRSKVDYTDQHNLNPNNLKVSKPLLSSA
jgi:hypothetical protein